MKQALLSCCCLRRHSELRGQQRAAARRSPTAADAKTFLDTVNDTMKRLGIEQSRAGWVQQTFITDDTEALSARANQLAIDAAARFAKDAVKFDKVDVPTEQRRQLNLLKVGLVMATPADPKESEELTKIDGAARIGLRQGQMVPRPEQAGRVQDDRRRDESHGDVEE